MNIYSIDVRLSATAYIKADNPEDALKLARETLTDTDLQLSSRYEPVGDNLCIDGRPFECLLDNEEDIALSPAMMVWEPIHNYVDLVE